MDDIKEVRKRGTVYLHWDGPKGAELAISGGGQSMILKADLYYEIDVRNPILVNWRVKRYYMITKRPHKKIVQEIGKKVTGSKRRNKFTSLKTKETELRTGKVR